MLKIVVAHYNNSHFQELASLFPQDNTLVYDKSGTYESDIYNVKYLENVGRESETYLHYIIENYDTLNDYILFIQDDTDNHIKSVNTFYDITNHIINNKIPFYQYETSWRRNGGIAKRVIRDGYLNLHTLPSHTSIKEFCTEFGIALPKSYTTELCAFFIVSKGTIRKRPKEFYVALRSWLLANPKRGFVMEHVWVLIFG